MGSLRLKNLDLYELDRMGHDLVVLGIFEDERPIKGLGGLIDWRTHGRISRIIKSGFFSGKWGERMLYPPGKWISARRLLLLGLGRRDEFFAEEFAAFLRAASENSAKLHAKDLAISVPGWLSEEDVFEEKRDVKLALIIEDLVEAVPNLITLFLPKEINLKEISLVVSTLARRIHVSS